MTVKNVRFKFLENGRPPQCLDFCATLDVERIDNKSVVKALQKAYPTYRDIVVICYSY